MIRTEPHSAPDSPLARPASASAAERPGVRHAARDWIGLDEARRRLGVSATTLRRWADAGIVQTFVTPGGHRRFDAESIRTLLPGTTRRPTMEQLGETPERISRAYRRVNKRSGLPWVGALNEDQRSAFRDHGNAVARELLAALDAATGADRAAHLAAASATAAQYGVAAAARGITGTAMVETFLQFRRPFLLELAGLAQRRGLDTSAGTELVMRASDAFDQLLTATMQAFDAALAAAPDRHRTARSAGVRGPSRAPASDSAAMRTRSTPLEIP